MNTLSFPFSKVKKSRRILTVFYDGMNTVLRDRQFQPADAPLITELCGESL
jgi:hypothetical protein